MHITHLGRTIAGLAISAVTFSALAAPASAGESPTFDGAALESFASQHAPGRYSAADLTDEGPNIDRIETLADAACAVSDSDPSADLILLDYQESGIGPAAFTISADVSIDDDPSNREVTCNFAVLLTTQGTTFNGSYSFVVEDPLLVGKGNLTGPVSGDVVGVGPVFTDIEYYAQAALSASGNQLTPSQRVVNVPVTTPKTAAQAKSAKKAYDKRVKAAKKAYKKAGKTKKAKKAYNRKLTSARTGYRRALAPTTSLVAQTQAFVATAPWAVSILMNRDDEIA